MWSDTERKSTTQRAPARGNAARPAHRTPASDPAAPPDMVLVRRVKGGDTEAFNELVRRYQDRVYTVISGQVRNPEDALDLTQEVFVKAYRSLPAFRENSVFYTWLYRIAINACIDFARRRERALKPISLCCDAPDGMELEPEDVRPSANPERCLLNSEMGSLLRDWIQSLPDAMRMALILHDVEGLSQEETAQVMGCPLGTAKSRIQRAREELRRRLKTYLPGE